MKFRDKSVLLISPEDWGENWISKHHYAALLAGAGNSVYFLGPNRPPSGKLTPPPPGITLLPSVASPKGLRFFPPFLRRLVYRRIGKKLSELAGASFDIVWSFEPSRYLDLDSIAPQAFRIFYKADHYDWLPWEQVARSSHVCIAPSQGLLKKLQKVNNSSYYLNHGYAALDGLEFDFETSGPNVVYAGNLSSRLLDRERLLQLLSRSPDVTFHFFGDTGEGNLGTGTEHQFVAQLRNFANVKIYGSVSPATLHTVYRKADLLLLCYDPHNGPPLENAHKVMEYLASGTPILSTTLSEYTQLPHLIHMRDDVDHYCESLHKLLEESNPEFRSQRIEFALNNRYDKQLERIEAFCHATPLPDPRRDAIVK